MCLCRQQATNIKSDTQNIEFLVHYIYEWFFEVTTAAIAKFTSLLSFGNEALYSEKNEIFNLYFQKGI